METTLNGLLLLALANEGPENGCFVQVKGSSARVEIFQQETLLVMQRMMKLGTKFRSALEKLSAAKQIWARC